VAIVAAAAVVVLIVSRGSGHAPPVPSATASSTPTATASSAPLPTCDPSGCGVVSVSRSLPATTVFYGASCSGVYGSWFLNVSEGGGSDALRPAYLLRWSLAPGSSSAKPSGQILIPPTSSTQVTLRLTNGTLSLTGTRKPNTTVSATGTLVVQVRGPQSAQVLQFTETGLRRAEQSLGLVSPFDVNGQPLTLPVQTVKKLTGC
jgi:hypothetical protein